MEKTNTSIDNLVKKAMGNLITNPELWKARPWDARYTLQEIQVYAPSLPGATFELAWKASTEVCANKQDIPLVAAVLQHKIAAISNTLSGSYLDVDKMVSCDTRCSVSIVCSFSRIDESKCRIVHGISTDMTFAVKITGTRHSQDYTAALIHGLEAQWNKRHYTNNDLREYKVLRRRESRWNVEVMLLQIRFASDGWAMFVGNSGYALRANLGRIMVDGFMRACTDHNRGMNGCEPPTMFMVDSRCRILLGKCDGANRDDLAEAAATRYYAKH